MESSPYQQYEQRVLSIARLYYGLYVAGRQSTDVDVSDLEQAGRIAVFNVATKRPEKLNHPGYVSAAIKYACINEIKKMGHKRRQVYLAHQHDEEVPIIDLLPTRESSPDKLDQLDDLLYQVRQEFSPVEADALDALVQKCSDVYDLNLSAPPSTDTKDRVKVVTAMDLDDEEMMIYAQVLTGARKILPNGYCQPQFGGRERGKKFFSAVQTVLGLDTRELVKSHGDRFFEKYRLKSFIAGSYEDKLRDFLMDVDPTIKPQEIPRIALLADEMRKLILDGIKLASSDDRCDKRRARRLKQFWRIREGELRKGLSADNATRIFRLFGSVSVMIEYAFPGTFPALTPRALEIWNKYNSNGADFFSKA